MMRVVCASANPDKVAEIAALLEGQVDLVPRPAELADVVEDADTLEGNARLKAVAVCAATGLPAVADDTGLFVSALDGAPGVHTGRFAGDDATYADNCAKLLDELAGLPDGPERAAAFRTVVLVRWPSGEEVTVDGVCRGRVATALRPGRGFGYDPLFVPDEGDGRSFSEMSAAEKNAISHRGRAFSALLAALRAR